MKICLLTPGQPSTNPRLVKEADVLAEAGFDVHVVTPTGPNGQAERTANFSHRNGGRLLSWAATQYDGQRISLQDCATASGCASQKVSIDSDNYEGRHWRVSRQSWLPQLRPSPRQIWNVAHNLGALPAAVAGAARYRRQAAFDAEDFHSAMAPSDSRSRRDDLAEEIEAECLPQCSYVTAAAPLIAEAYAQKYRIALPGTILNVFPLTLTASII